jgi:hypothetical protein
VIGASRHLALIHFSASGNENNQQHIAIAAKMAPMVGENKDERILLATLPKTLPTIRTTDDLEVVLFLI